MRGCTELKEIGAAPCDLLSSGLESKPMNSSRKGGKIVRKVIIIVLNSFPTGDFLQN